MKLPSKDKCVRVQIQTCPGGIVNVSPTQIMMQDQVKLPTRDELTEDDRAAIDAIVGQAMNIADKILSSDPVDPRDRAALNGLANHAAGSGLYTLPPRCHDALARPLTAG